MNFNSYHMPPASLAPFCLSTAQMFYTLKHTPKKEEIGIVPSTLYFGREQYFVSPCRFCNVM